MTSITPVRLRIILSLCLIILIVIGISLFSVGYSRLKLFSVSVQTVAADAQTSQTSVQDLVTTKQFLAQNQDAVTRASQLVAESKSYVYQDQIITDISTYAKQAGLTISNITFSNPSTAAVAAVAAPQPAAGAVAGALPTASGPVGVKSMTASVTIKNPAQYTSILNFTHLIEQSLFRMQISQIGLSAAGADQPGQVNSDILTIEVYVR